MGCHAAIDIYFQGRAGNKSVISVDDDFQEGDLCWLETPVNPTGMSRYGLSELARDLCSSPVPVTSNIMRTRYFSQFVVRPPYPYHNH